MLKYFISGIGTDVGKTVVSAIFCKAFQAAYWIPIQTGSDSDTERVKTLAGLSSEQIYKEAYHLPDPISPHAAARKAGIEIELKNLVLPKSSSSLIVEGAGGLLVPLNDTETNLDLIQSLRLPVILVSRHYLGSINHSLMSLEILKQQKIVLAGLVFVGDENLDSENRIKSQVKTSFVHRIPILTELTCRTIEDEAQRLLLTLSGWK